MQRSLNSARFLAQTALVAALYFLAAKASLGLAIPPGYATAVWPPSGIALAAIFLLPAPAWPGVWLGAAAVNYTVHSSLFAAAVIGCGNTFEAVAAAALMRRFAAVPGSFARGEDALKFIVLCALSASIATTVALLALSSPLSLERSLDWQELRSNGWTWWQGDAFGMIIVAPLILGWFRAEKTRWTGHRALEALGLGAVLVASTAVIFRAGAAAQYSFLIIPLVVVAAFRFGQREVTTAIAAVCGIALWHTVDGRGPLASASLNDSLLLMLAFVSTLAATGLVVCAVVGERRRAMEELRRTRDDLQNQAITDPLTGLYNRRYLREFARRELARSARRDAPFAVVMIDLDHFKRVNDAYGHEAGDLLLTLAAELLNSQIRTSDIACRYGGEEFALILPDAGAEDAHARAESIRAALKHLQPEHRAGALRITASLGVASFPEHGETLDELIAAADQALYAAKKAGRDQVAMASRKYVAPQTASLQPRVVRGLNS